MMLDVKTQLIYPSGSQQVLDGHPGRWQVTQEAFKIVKLHLGLLRRKFPRGIEVIDRERGSFPTIYLLKDDVKQDLIRRVTDSILQGMLACSLASSCLAKLFSIGMYPVS